MSSFSICSSNMPENMFSDFVKMCLGICLICCVQDVSDSVRKYFFVYYFLFIFKASYTYTVYQSFRNYLLLIL